jgi:hypothetical protein
MNDTDRVDVRQEQFGQPGDVPVPGDSLKGVNGSRYVQTHTDRERAFAGPGPVDEVIRP